MARALVTKLRIPDTAAQTRKSPVARSGRAEASCHDISNTWLAHGYSSSSPTCPARQSSLCRPCPACKNVVARRSLIAVYFLKLFKRHRDSSVPKLKPRSAALRYLQASDANVG